MKHRGLALLLAALAALGAVAVNEGAYRLAQQSLLSLRERDSARHQTTQLLGWLADAESAQRGYLLTGRDEYLEPLRQAEQAVASMLPTLSRHYAQGEWRSTVEELSRRTDEKLSELKETVALYRAGSHDAWQALTLTNIGKEKMDAVRVATQSLVALESARIATDRATIERALLLGRLGVHGLTLLALLWLVLYLQRSVAVTRRLGEDRDRLDAEVLRRTAELTELARHLQTVREDERARLARELHDELGALLTAAKLDLARLRKGAAPELTQRLTHLGGLIDEGIQLKRRIIEDLRPSALANLGLEAALEILISEFGPRSGLELKAELQPVPLDAEGQLAVYRLVQEALTNVHRHAQAKRVHLRLHESEGQVRLRLEDDGRGFDAGAQRVGSHGLVGMRYRIEALGGRLAIASGEGQGTVIEAWLPLGETWMTGFGRASSNRRPMAKVQPLRPTTSLPADVDGVLRLAAQSLFDHLAEAAQGMLLLDREHRIVWINDGYKRFLPALGFDSETEFVGHRIEEVVPATLLPQVIDSDRPMLVDLLTNKAGTFVVSRLPLHDAAGQVIGAVGLVLADDPGLQPLVQKFAHLQQQLADARRQLSEQRRPKYTISSFVGASFESSELKRQARRVAQLESSVLLLGETGTGKELLAHAIHAASPRAARPLVGINIAAIPDTLLEAELFGVAPGAYTGAERKGRDGKFAIADGGTLFLDEIGDMPLALQSKLLRVLQEQEFEPLGSNTVRRIDVRVIAATSRNLSEMVAAGSFRADLYYRLAVLPLRVPPLRERRDDIELLVEALSEDIARRSGMPLRTLGADAIALLQQQPWPGNIRELRNVLEQASMMSDELHLGARHFAGLLPHAALPVSSAEPAPAGSPESPERWLRPLSEQLREVERRAIAAALAQTGGNKVATAKLLRISRAALYEKLALYSL